MKPIIHVKGLKRSFKQYKKQPGLVGSIKSLFIRKYFEIQAVKGVSFDINEGEIVGFIGPNGAGKTTTLKMLSGILHPTQGDVTVLGYKPYERNPVFQKQFSLVMGQKTQLWWDLPPMETFLLNKHIYGLSDEEFNESLNELINLLEIQDVIDVPVRKLSLGQRMKCELAASLIHKPKVLFLDEPTIGLDIVIQKKIRQFLKEYNLKNKVTIILTSHYMDDVAELCRRIIIIDKGGIVVDEDLLSVINKYATSKYLKLVFLKNTSIDTLKKYGEVLEYEPNGLSATIKAEKSKNVEVASSMLKNLAIDDLDISEASLEDIIRNIFEKA